MTHEMMSSDIVTVVGGSGFVGRHVVRALAKRGLRVRVAVRRPDLAFHLQPLGSVGQIHAVQANVRYPHSLISAMDGASAVVNLVGILQPTGRQTFEAVQHDGASAVATAASKAGVKRLIHLSAIGADANSQSVYAQTKALGEQAAQSAFGNTVIVRPSVVFGPEDQFFNRFAALARMLPVLPLPGGGTTRLQPVFVGDVAEVVARAVQGDVAAGVYELGGAQVKTLREIVSYICELTGRKRFIAPLPWQLARIQAGMMEFADKMTLGLLPDDLMVTRDQVTLLQTDNVVSQEAQQAGRTLEGLGITPSAYEAIVPSYLWRFRKTGQFEANTQISDV